MEVGAGGEAGARFEDRGEALLGRARIGGRLQHDRGTAGEERRQLGARHIDEGEVGDALAQWGGHRDDGDVEGRDPVEARHRLVPPGGEGGSHLGVGDVFDE